jgi:hypothetical protein
MMNELEASLNTLGTDSVGWLFFVVSFAIPLLSETIRKNQTLLLACWFTIFLHHSAAITNSYLFTLPGCEGDAHGMQTSAIKEGLVPSLDTLPYVLVLRAIYELTGVSQFLGSELSVCSFSMSLVLFVDLCRLCKTRMNQAVLVLLFSCWPVTIINSSVTLRESYQVLAILCVAWSLVALQSRKGQLKPYFVLLAGIFMLFNLHRGLVFYSLAMALVAYTQLAKNALAMLLSSCLIFGFLAGGLWVSESKQSIFSKLTGGFDVAAAVTYRDNITGGRASYNVPINTKSVPGFFLSLTLCLILYMFAPLPWMVTGLPDLYALVESIFRMWMVFGLFANIKESQGDRRGVLILLAILFWSLEFMWSIGTSNWGQAIRHRAVGYAFLVILGGDWWLARLSQRIGAQVFGEPQNNGFRLKAT